MQFKDELKQQYGKFTDDELRRIGGNYDKFIGKVQERYGEKIGRTHEVGGPVAAAVSAGTTKENTGCHSTVQVSQR
ncbi:MAG TPA: hypothetical protein VK626_00270 [Nitrospiraceae bacterium]|nr:hypothetical protein [Nitrospiraceae bacterium]